MRGIPQSLFDQGSELSRTGEFVTVSEDRIQAVRNRSVDPVFPNQISWYAKVFQFSSQPSRSFFVLVGVSYECSVLVRSLAQFRCIIYRIEGTGKDSRLLFVSGFMSGNP